MNSVWFVCFIISLTGLTYFLIRFLILKWRVQKTILEEKERLANEVQRQLEDWRGREVDGIRQREAALANERAETELKRWKQEEEGLIRKDAISKSQAVTFGKVTEHLLPFRSEFEYNPKDARFIGSPIDFIVFNGLSEGSVDRVVFVEIKTGQSGLTTRERRIRDAVLDGRVDWVEMRFNPDLDESRDEVEQVLVALRSGMEQGLSDPNEWYEMGVTLYEFRMYQDSLTAYSKAIECDASHVHSWYNTACIHAIEGKAEEAITALTKAIELDAATIEEAKQDPDFAGLADHDGFKQLVGCTGQPI